jgi:RNA polymerase sigma-70 factor (ECF subfamily)
MSTAQYATDFAELRPLLFSIAYRMLGSVADAEDIVQEAYLRCPQIGGGVENPRAYLSTIVTRLCIDHLRASSVRRERAIGVTIPEPIDALYATQPQDELALGESLSLAFLTMLQHLAPIERAAFILREIFDFEYEEIAAMIGKSAPNCRQIVSRARRTLGGGRSRFAVDATQVRSVVERFVAAARTGDVSALLGVLAPDVELHADAGEGRPSYGRLRAVSRPVRGARAVARLVAAAAVHGPTGARIEIAELNGSPVILSYADTQLIGMVCLDVADFRVANLFILADPTKLARIAGLCAH